MDYSMLLGIHNLEKEKVNTTTEAYYEAKIGDAMAANTPGSTANPPPTSNTTANNTQTQSTLSAERANSTSNDSVQPSTSSANQSISSPVASNYKSSIMSSSSKNWDNFFNMCVLFFSSSSLQYLFAFL